jgi:hypothetical protein
MTTPTPTPADRLALAVCRASLLYRIPTCPSPCRHCSRISQGVTRELAAILRERHGSSATADWLEAIGSYASTATETL